MPRVRKGRLAVLRERILDIFRTEDPPPGSDGTRAPTPGGVFPTVPAPTYNKTPAMSMTAPMGLRGGRQTLPTNANVLGTSVAPFFVWRRDYQDIDIASINISDYTASDLLSILADVNPDVGRALWNVLRVAGSTITFTAKKPTGTPDKTAQKLLDDLTKRLNWYNGGFRNIVIQMLTSAYMQGAVALDIAPTDSLDDIEDFFPVNPATIYFSRDADQEPHPYQRQPGAWGQGPWAPFRRLNEALFIYTPIDPYIDDLYGRAAATPVLQIVFFQAQVLRDLQRVLHVQGWPKIDISVVMEILENNMPPDKRVDPNARAQWINDRMNDIMSAYASMEPEDAFIHPDWVAVTSEAVKAGSNMFDVKGLLSVIRQQMISALKQLPVLMGENSGETETYSGVELKIFSNAVEAFRLPVGEALARAFEVALQLMGRPAVVEAQWPVLEIFDRMAMANTQAQVAVTAAYLRDQGWTDQDEAAQTVVGHEPVAPGPIMPQTASGPNQGMPAPPTPPQAPKPGSSNGKNTNNNVKKSYEDFLREYNDLLREYEALRVGAIPTFATGDDRAASE